MNKQEAQTKFQKLGRLETLLYGYYQGSIDSAHLKVSTGYHPGFEVIAYAHSGDRQAFEALWKECERVSRP